jgi:uncharacterized membrane protein
VTINAFVSTQSTLDAGATGLVTLTLPKITLKAGGTAVETLKFKYPKNVPDGTYFFLTATNTIGTSTTPNISIASAPVNIARPAVDLASYFAGGLPVKVTPGKSATASITVQNLGNVNAVGSYSLALYDSSNTFLDGSANLLTSLNAKRISLAPGRSVTYRVRFTAPSNLAAGSYHLIAATFSGTAPSDHNAANDTAVIATTA